MSEVSPSPDNSPSLTRMVWVDGAGGFLLLDQDEVRMGRFGCEINLIADVGRVAGTLRRLGEDWAWEANDSDQTETEWWNAPQEIQVGRSLRCRWERPNALSQTHRMVIQPPHRFAEPVDAALFVSGVVVIGPTDDCHIVVRHAEDRATLRLENGKIKLRHQGTSIELEPNQSQRSGWLSLQLEEKQTT